MTPRPLSLPAETENELPAGAAVRHNRRGALTVAASDTATAPAATDTDEPATPEPFHWTAAEWERGRQVMLRTRHAQGLPDTIEDPIALHRAGVILADV